MEKVNEGMVSVNAAVPPRLLTLKAAARVLGVSVWTCKDWVHAGVLPVVRIPSGRVDSGRSRGDKRGAVRVVAAASDERMKPLRRYLIDARDVEKLIDRFKDGSL